MATSTVCSQCMRALRQASFKNSPVCPLCSSKRMRMCALQQSTNNIQIKTTSKNHTSYTIRSISSNRPFLQKENVPNPQPYTEPPPITSGTVTANITAAAPSETPTQPPTPSTADMQRHLTSKLARPRTAILADNLAQKLRQTAKSTTESYITYGLTEAFFKSCSAQAPYTIPEEQRTKVLTEKGPPRTASGEDLGIAEADTFWFRDLDLPPTFSTWSQITYLHMYLVTVRLRALEDPRQFRDYQRYLIEHFSNAAEDKMVLLHSINARGIRNRYLKDLFVQWRGCLAAYDEGLVKGDAVLASAVWRNLWKGEEGVDWEKVAVVVAYMRKAVHTLGMVPLDELAQNLDGGRKVWEEARRNVRAVVAQRSRGVAEPL